MLKRNNWLLLFLCGVVFFSFLVYLYKDQPTENGYLSISAQEAKSILAKEEKVILLDVRNPDEYIQERIPGSMLIPLNQLDQQVEGILTDKGQTILVYCRSGVRSKEGAAILVNKGYTNVLEMGGIIHWPYEKERGI